jgi:hypothetical protein
METLNIRIQEKLAELSNEKEGHLAAARRLENQISKLALLAEGEEDPDMEVLLQSILNPVQAQEPPLPQPVPPPPPPPPPTQRVMIKADKIYAASQTFDGLFTLNQITDMLCDAEGVTDREEKTRVRSAISSMLAKLASEGRVIHVEKGRGKLQGTFRKVSPRSIPGYKNGAPADIEVNHVHVEVME